MGRNAIGGKHHKKGKNHNVTFDKRELRFKEELQDYAIVEKVLGDCRVDCRCQDGEQRVCHIRGKMKKRVWISVGDVVLIGIRDFQQDKADVIHKYTPSEALLLVQYNEITFPQLVSALDSESHSTAVFDSSLFSTNEVKTTTITKEGEVTDVDIDTI